MGQLAAVAVERRPVEAVDCSAEWWRQHDLAELEFHLREAQLDVNTAEWTLADPDATSEQRDDAKIIVAGADSVIVPLEDEIARLESLPPSSGRPVSERSTAPANGRLRIARVARPRERRAQPARRSSSRAGPDSDSSDSDGEHPLIRRRKAAGVTGPLRTVWEALERADCKPYGPQHNFRARCPAHDGNGRETLHVSVGADGRALLHCFSRRCRAEDVAAALGLSVSDLFPAGHRQARRRQLREARRSDFNGTTRTLANILLALEQLDARWAVDLRVDCAHCGSPHALVHADSRGGGAFLMCASDETADELGYEECTLDEFVQALAGRVEDRKGTT